MTTKKLAKYIGHRVHITMHEFKHSVSMIEIEGGLYATKGTHAVPRNERIQKYEHLDFCVDAWNAYYFIDWNKVSLITKLEDLGEIEHEEI